MSDRIEIGAAPSMIVASVGGVMVLAIPARALVTTPQQRDASRRQEGA